MSDDDLRAYRIGVMQLTGPADARDLAAGVAAVRAAALAGFPPAMFRLGVIYALGQHVERDDAEAARWIRDADLARDVAARGEEPAAEPATEAGVADGPLPDAVNPPPSLRHLRSYVQDAALGARAALEVDLLTRMEEDLFGPHAPRRKALERSLAEVLGWGLGIPADQELGQAWMRRAAEVGDPVAQLHRGMAALKQAGDPLEARRWLTPAAQADNLEASRWLDWLDDLAAAEASGGFRLGMMLCNSDGAAGNWPGPDPERGARLLTKLAEAGDLAAAGTLAWLHLIGRGLPSDPDAARGWYERILAHVAPRLAGAGDGHDALIELGHGQTLDAGLMRQQLRAIADRPVLEARAAGGDADAMLALADLCVEGLGGPYDPARATRLRDAAAAAGDPQALYARNQVIVNPAHLDALRRAADAGHRGCAFVIGRELIDDDLPAALAYLTQAAEGGDGDAQYLLGELHRDGLPVGAPDWAAAAPRFAEAARRAHWAAAMEAGRMYRAGGHGLGTDPTIAREMYGLAADLGDPQADFALGVMLARGEGGTPDPAGAYLRFRQAAARGEADAVPWLARLRDQLPATELAALDADAG